MEKNLAIETFKAFIENSDNDIMKDAIIALHPQLKESDDEKIRKDLIESIKIGKRTGITFTETIWGQKIFLSIFLSLMLFFQE